MARCVLAHFTIGEISEADNKQLKSKIWLLYKSIVYSLDRFSSSEVQSQVAELSRTLSAFDYLFDKIDVQSNYYYLGYRLGNTPSAGGLTREEILELINNAIEHIDVDFTQEDIDRWNSYQTSITQNAREILLKANQSELVPINGKLSEHEASISLTAQQIALKVSRNDFDLLGQQVASYDTVINQTAQEIALKASKSELDTVTGRVAEAEASLTIQAGQIQSKASTSTVNALGERLTTAETSITQTANQIQSKAEQSTVDALTGRVTTAESSITQNAQQIELKVSNTDFTGSNLVSKINLEPSNIKIQSKNINLVGAVTISSFDSALTEDYNAVKDAAVNASTFEYVELIKNDLQGQIDGAIDSYFEQVDPQLTNYPASTWTTTELKESHANDTYTNTSTGASWRWVLEGGNWFWKVIADTATQQALVLAGQAKSTADGKRTTYRTQPYPPYLIGDLWSQGSAGELMVCTTARATGNFTASDWTPATDAQAKLAEAKAHAEAKVTELQNALGDLAYGDTVGIDKIDPALTVNGKIKAGALDVQGIVVQGDIETTAGAQAKVDAVKIGGRNLLLNTAGIFSSTVWNDSIGIVTPSIQDGYLRLYLTNVVTAQAYISQKIRVTESTAHVFGCSFYNDTNSKGTRLEIYSNAGILLDSYTNSDASFGLPEQRWTTVVTPIDSYLEIRFWNLGLKSGTLGGNAVFKAKLEVGNKATDWTPAPEDVDASIAKVETTADIIGKALGGNNYLTSLETALNGKSVLVGGLLNNEIVNTNTLIAKQMVTSGVNRITINENEDNFIKLRHTNGVVGIEMGIIGGALKLVFYDINGNKVWEAGQEGLVYVDTIPESWSQEQLRTILATSEYPLSETTKNTIKSDGVLRDSMCKSADGSYMGVVPGTIYYRYSAGRNGTSESNKIYEGLHTSQNKFTTNWIPNGYYLNTGFLAYTNPQETTINVTLSYYQSGKLLGTEIINGVTKNTANTCSF